MRSAPDNAELVRVVLVTAGVLALIWFAWQLSDLLLLVFGAIVIGTVLRSFGDLIADHTPLRHPWSLAVAGLLVVVLMAVFVLLLGMQIRDQFITLSEQTPALLEAAGDRLGIADLAARVGDALRQFLSRSSVLGNIAGYTSAIVSGVGLVILVTVAGIYLAVSPETYRNGFLLLVPRAQRENVGSAIDNAGRALQAWLVGQLLIMVILGVAVTVGLTLIGMPSALALGFLAGMLEFIPFIGPIVSAIPALILGLSQGGHMVWYVLGLYVLIQQAENNFIVPLVQRRTVELPPVLGMFAIVGLGALLGPLGVVLGVPLVVVALVLVKQLYVREALGTQTSVPGEEDESGQADGTAVSSEH